MSGWSRLLIGAFLLANLWSATFVPTAGAAFCRPDGTFISLVGAVIPIILNVAAIALAFARMRRMRSQWQYLAGVMCCVSTAWIGVVGIHLIENWSGIGGHWGRFRIVWWW